MDDEDFKGRLKEISVDASEVSILLPDENFDCSLNGSIEMKPIMFLGLNRSLPKIYSMPYHNMRGPLLEFFKSSERGKEIFKKIEGAYLTDFIKNKILKESEFDESKKKTGTEVFKHIQNKEDLLRRCRKILDEEIRQFEIEKIFVFGKVTWKLLEQIYKEDVLNEDNGFYKIPHYSKANRKNWGEILDKIVEGLK